jgi:hypothetical protein
MALRSVIAGLQAQANTLGLTDVNANGRLDEKVADVVKFNEELGGWKTKCQGLETELKKLKAGGHGHNTTAGRSLYRRTIADNGIPSGPQAWEGCIHRLSPHYSHDTRCRELHLHSPSPAVGEPASA